MSFPCWFRRESFCRATSIPTTTAFLMSTIHSSAMRTTDGDVTIIPGETYLWDFDANQDGNRPGPGGFGGGLTGVMINGTTDFEEFLQAPSNRPGQVINLDNVKFITAAGGGTTVIEEVSNGDPTLASNDGEFLFHTGVTRGANAATMTFHWSVFNPITQITGEFQQIGGYIGTGDQSNYLKVAAVKDGLNTASIQVSLEDNDLIPMANTYTLPANDIFDVTQIPTDAKIFFELEVDVLCEEAIPTVTYETMTGMQVVHGTPVLLTGTTVLQAAMGNYTVQGQASGLAVGLFATNTGQAAADAFQAIFDDIEITAIEGQFPPDAQDDTKSTDVNTILTIPVAELLANDSDPNPADMITVTGVLNAQNGTAVFDDQGNSDPSDDVVVFTPDLDFEGVASFDYSITDGIDNDTATVTVNVITRAVIYRVNAGGPEVAALASDPLSSMSWAANTGAGAQSGIGFSNNTGNISFNSIANQNDPGARDASLPDYVPYQVFQTERWDPFGPPEMQWSFHVTPGFTYEVHLFVRNGYGGTSNPGQRVFDVEIEGVEYFSDVDLSGSYGHQVGAMLNQTVTMNDDVLDIRFLHDDENPLINAIEIAQVGVVEPLVSIQGGNQTVSEGVAGGQVQIPLAIVPILPSNESVDITFEIVPGLATPGAGGDYEYTSGSATFSGGIYTDTVSIAAGSSDVTVLIDILQDMDIEMDESFSLNITGISGNASIGEGSATITIADDDAPPIDTFNGMPVPGNELSDDRLNPTDVVLQLGSNTLVASQSPSDLDYVTFEVQPGHQLFAANLLAYDGGTNLTFLGIHTGDIFPDENILVNGGPDLSALLDGGTLYGDTLVGTDILDELTSTIIEGDGRIVAGLSTPLEAGLYTLWFSQNGSPTQSTLELVTQPLPGSGTIVAAINAGGPALTQDGIDFSADQFFDNGTVFVDNTAGNGEQPAFDGTVYESERYGGNHGGTMSYSIPVDPGTYTVELHFAEIYHSAIGARVFDVLVEGQLVLDDLDILAETGGDINQPFVFQVPGIFSPNDAGGDEADKIDINFRGAVDNGKISGIVIRDVGPQAVVGAAELAITVNSNNVQVSNYGNDSFQITNTGSKDIQDIVIDVAGALFPDSVFDPFGVAGDTVSKRLTINTAGDTGVIAPDHGTSSNPGTAYIGAGGIAGFDSIQLFFDAGTSGGFNPGETLGFSVDMDPNSIAGSDKTILDSGTIPSWDVGGVSGAELIGSTFTITFTDGTTATGQLQGVGNLGGSRGVASQDSPGLTAILTVNGLGAGGVGTYTAGGPSVIIEGPVGETARIVLAKGIIQPVNNNFSEPYASQLNAQLAALAASDFPANNAAEFQTVDVVLTGVPQDISGLFDFTQVPNFVLAVDESQVPLGFVASIIDPANSNLPVGSVSAPIYLQSQVTAEISIDDPSVVEEADVGETTLSFTLTSNEPMDGDVELDFTISGAVASAPTSPATVTFAAGIATLEVTVANDDLANGDEQIGITLLGATVPVGSTVTAAVVIDDSMGLGTITEDDFAPTAGDDAAFAISDRVNTILASELFANDTDADNIVPDDLSLTGVGTDGQDGATAEGGAVMIDGNGNVVYRSLAGFSGQDSFLYTVSDVGGNTDQATVTVSVTDLDVAATVTVNGDTTGTSAFTVQNASQAGVTIRSVSFDIGSAVLSLGLDVSGLPGSEFLGAAWDPTGEGGDAESQGIYFAENVAGLVDDVGTILNPITTGSGYIGIAGSYPFTQRLAGGDIGAPGGYRLLTLNFDNFDSAENFGFSVDVDPQSIQNADGTGQAGAVSGGEVAGMNITIVFEGPNGEIIVETRPLEVTALDSSTAAFDGTVPRAAPTLDIVGLTSGDRRVETPLTEHTVDVSGLTPGDAVRLYVFDGSGYEKHGASGSATVPDDPFHANQFDAAPTILNGVANASGLATFVVNLTDVTGAVPATVDGLFFFSAGIVDTNGNLTSGLADPAELKIVPNAPPTVTLDNAVLSLPEDTDTTHRVKVADIVVVDDNVGTNIVRLAGADALSFEIDGTELYLKAGTSLDFETQTQLNVIVEVNDPTLAPDPNDSVSLSIDITDVADAPIITLDPVPGIDENQVITLSGTLTLQQVLSTVTLDVDWGDPLSPLDVQSFILGTTPLTSGNDGIDWDPVALTFAIDHLYLDDNPSGDPSNSYTISVSATDAGGTGSVNTSVIVGNVAPVVAAGASQTVEEGESVAFAGAFTDVGTLDSHSIEWDFGDGSSASDTLTPTHTYADDGAYTVTLTVVDDDGGSSMDSLTVTVGNVAPVIDPIADETAFVNAGFSKTVSFTDPGEEGDGDPVGEQGWLVHVDFDGDATADRTFYTVTRSFDISNGTPFVYSTTGVFTASVTVDDEDGGVDTETFAVDVVNDTLRVIAFTSDASGFAVTFNHEPDLEDLNLYDGADAPVEIADVDLVGSVTGAVRGSMTYEPATSTLHFVKTGGILADDMYTVTLRSDAEGFNDAGNGSLLDGDSNFLAGTDFTTTFTVSQGAARVVGLVSDFARGAGQTVDLTPGNATDDNLTINISDAADVTAVDLHLRYNPALLDIATATKAIGLPGDWSVTANFGTPGLLELTAFGTTPLSGSDVAIYDLAASIPAAAPYGASQRLEIVNLSVNSGTLSAVGDSALHKAVFLGDASGNGSSLESSLNPGQGLLSAFDASLVARVVDNLDSGFDAHDWTDPVIVADVARDGTLSGLDASAVAYQSVELPPPNDPIPAFPHVTYTQNSGPDPTVQIDEGYTGVRGQVTPVFVEITDDGTGLQGANLEVRYDSIQLDLANGDVNVGDLLSGWTVVAHVDDATGLARIAAFSATPLPSGTGNILQLDFTVDINAPIGTTVLDVEGQLNEGELTITPIDGSFVVGAVSAVEGRHIFYENSSYDDPDGSGPLTGAGANASDDGAIADKQPLIPGVSGNSATFDNYTSYSRGINGIMVDIAGLPMVPTLLTIAEFFEFRVGNDNTFTAPGWTDAPVPMDLKVRLGEGDANSDRVTIIWADNAIQKQWLEVTVLANASTGLTSEDVHYWGNYVGETGNSTLNAAVDLLDRILVRDNQTNFLNPADITNPYDFNRDESVDLLDRIFVRDNQSNFLTELVLISPGLQAGRGGTAPLGRSAAGQLRPDSSGSAAHGLNGFHSSTVVTNRLTNAAPAEAVGLRPGLAMLQSLEFGGRIETRRWQRVSENRQETNWEEVVDQVFQNLSVRHSDGDIQVRRA